MPKDDYIQRDPTWLYKVVDDKVDGKIYTGEEIVTAKKDGWKDTPGQAEEAKKKTRKPKAKAKEAPELEV